MINFPTDLIDEFAEAAFAASLIQSPPILTHELLSAPHLPPKSLPLNQCAVYVFSLSSRYGESCPAGPNRALKVGKVGANSSARFCSQHYLPNSANSNLAKSLLTEKVLWPYLGITYLDEFNVKEWMLANLDRDNLFVSKDSGLERHIERFFRGQLGPVFEG